MATELIFGVGGFILAIVTTYNIFNAKSIKHATDITLLQSEVEHLKIVGVLRSMMSKTKRSSQ
ncbi:phage holin [Streptococcus pyogenes]|nr:phage holin [Streptococcus pyogenes]VHE12641.1 phage holin [Streptococcus pyogenes]VHE17804.1 phage holin [Streptococcus pyogenes]VHE23753.1 phage holin [Streptococcus pyogenes]VHG99843.1 phage holin [Streptococcus pyogenes]